MGQRGTKAGRIAAALLAVAALVVGCARSAHEQRDASPRQSTTTTRPVEDFVAEADDFVNVHDMTPVRNFYVDNRSGHLDEAVALARSAKPGTYPVGTIIQLVPQEAMVKRRAGFDPGSNDWEFFELDTSKTGTKIHARGGAEIVNRFGSGSCAGCHSAAGKKFDFVCEQTHGCEPLPFGREFFDAIQEADPRPRAEPKPTD